MTAREVALSTLLKTIQSRGYSNIELDSSIKKYGLEGVEKSFFTALFYGVIEKKLTLDYIIKKLSSRKLDDIDIKVLTIIELGLYQLMFMDKVPESAAVNESVKLCDKFYAPKNSTNFVNALLRQYIREKDNISYPDPKKNKYEYLSIKYSVPKWICELWAKSYGSVVAEKILESLSKAPFLTLRVNTINTTVDDLKNEITGLGLNVRDSKLAPSAIRLSSSTPIDALSSIENKYIIQDEASQAAVLALGVKPGDVILDCCACPGGKSIGAAIEANNDGKIYSFDLHKNKLSLIEKNASKLGITIIETAEQNGTKERNNMPLIDKIICDVPCSGLGVIAKKPDIRYKEFEDIKALPELQYKILENNSKYLKIGGDLVYSTCTLNPAENTSIIEKFLNEHKDFELCPFEIGNLKTNGMKELFPYEFQTDGFFIAKIRRIN